MLIETIRSPEEIEKASADCIEIRLDRMQLPATAQLPLPYLLTPKSHNPSLIEAAIKIQPPYLDLDIGLGVPFIQKVIRENPAIKVIVSYHNFETMPDCLNAIYEIMHSCCAFAYKIAIQTPSAIDALKLLHFKTFHPDLSVIAMGNPGQFARILAPIFGNKLNFASIGSMPQAPGQLSSQELRTIYRFDALNANTDIYALIGDPVDHSIGHLYHNQTFKLLGINCVYVKIQLRKEEVPDFFKLAKALNFKGLSVTSPLKEAVLPYIDEIDPKARAMGAVNTISLENGTFFGSNTDGVAAINAIEKKTAVAGKQVLILGAGGAARSIAYEAAERGAHVSIYARDPKRARLLGYPLGPPPSYDIVINCCGAHCLPVSFQHVELVMDINYHCPDPSFLMKAKLEGCEIIDGKEMFLGQAELQNKLWVSKSVKH